MTEKSSMTLVRKHAITVAVAVMLIVGLLGWWMSIDARSTSAAQNHAVVDAIATAEVKSEVAVALTKVLSYDYADPAATQKAAEALLSGKARTEYDTLYASLKERAPGQELLLTARVEAAGVKELSDNSAKLLVFLDQSSRRATDKEATMSAAQIAVTAKKINGTWKITELKTM